MTNPFDYLKIEREKQEKQLQEQQQLSKKREEEKLKLVYDAEKRKQDAFKTYDKVVQSLLQQLQQAKYPDFKVVSSRYSSLCWAIGGDVDDSYTDSDATFCSRTKWLEVVQVGIVFNTENQPTAFEIWAGEGVSTGSNHRKPANIKVGLSLGELTDGLKKTHPSNNE